MASVVSILVSARNQTTAALTAARTQTNRLGTSIAALTRRMTAQTRAVSSVAGAYQGANGMWYTANHRILVQRHNVTQVTTAFGRLVNGVRRAGSQVARFGNQLRAALTSALSRLRKLALDAATAMASMAIRWGPLLAVAAGAITALLPALVNLTGLLPLLAPPVVMAAAAFGALKFGLEGVKETIALGLSGDTEEYTKALKKLAPAAQQVVKSVIKMAPAFRDLKKTVQQALFKDLKEPIEDLAGVFMTTFGRVLPRFASIFNEAFRGIADFFKQPETMTQLNDILDAAAFSFKNILGTVKPLLQVLLDVTGVAAPRFALLTDSARKAAERFAEWVRQMRDSGKIGEWMDRAKDTFERLWEIGRQVVGVVKGIFTAGQGREQDFLEGVSDSLARLSEWARGPDGQEFFRGLASVAIAVAGIGNAIADLSEGFAEFRRWLRELGGTAEMATGRIGAAFAGLAMAMGGLITTAWRVAGGINAALSTIRTYIPITIGYREQGYARAINPGGSGGSVGGGRHQVRAAGGLATGLTWVGERGPELLDLGARGGRVHSNEASQRMITGSAQRQTVHVVLEPRPGLQRDLADAIIRNLAVRARDVGGWDRLIAGVA